MRVTVFDRAAETHSWGQPGGGHPVVRTVEIADTCPRCGGPRGEPHWKRQHEDGEWYTVSIWDNPCGHVDAYSAVIIEARRRAEIIADLPNRTLTVDGVDYPPSGPGDVPDHSANHG